jgi:hypothetical protein
VRNFSGPDVFRIEAATDDAISLAGHATGQSQYVEQGQTMWKLCCLAMVSFLVACSTSGPNDEKNVKVETESSGTVMFAHAKAYRDNGQLVVAGELEYLPWVKYGIFEGHVDVAVVGGSGVIVERNDIEPVMRHTPKTIGRRAWFIAKFQIAVPPETIVRIAYISPEP